MSVLVAYGSKRGGTQGLAEMIAAGLREEGLEAEVAPARQAGGAAGHDAVVVAGALYAFRWHRDARNFVRRHEQELRQVPTYLCSSGPLDDSAATREIPPVKGVARLMERVGARGHATFGGRLEPDAKGWPASAMAKKHAGDWRDMDHVRTWTHAIAAELAASATPPAP